MCGARSPTSGSPDWGGPSWEQAPPWAAEPGGQGPGDELRALGAKEEEGRSQGAGDGPAQPSRDKVQDSTLGGIPEEQQQQQQEEEDLMGCEAWGALEWRC